MSYRERLSRRQREIAHREFSRSERTYPPPTHLQYCPTSTHGTRGPLCNFSVFTYTCCTTPNDRILGIKEFRKIKGGSIEWFTGDPLSLSNKNGQLLALCSMLGRKNLTRNPSVNTEIVTPHELSTSMRMFRTSYARFRAAPN